MKQRLTLLFLLRPFVFLLIAAASATAKPYDVDGWSDCMAMCKGDTECEFSCDTYLNAVGSGWDDGLDYSGSSSGWDYSGSDSGWWSGTGSGMDYSGSGSGWDYSGSDGWDDGMDYSGSSSGWDFSGSGSGSGYYHDYV